MRRGGTLIGEGRAQVLLGNAAFAHDVPFIVAQIHDGRRDLRAGVAAIEDQRQPLSELVEKLVDIRARWKARNIGAGTGDGPTDLFDERAVAARIRPA